MKYRSILKLFLTALCVLQQSMALGLDQTEVIRNNLEYPWGLTELPDSKLLVTERVGRLSIVDIENKTVQEVSGLPDVYVEGQGGLMDVELHPDYAENGWIYLSYSATSFFWQFFSRHNTEVLRGKLDDGVLTHIEVIFEASPKAAGTTHFGSRIVFDGEGYLYISLGERGQSIESQNLGNHLGKVIRLHDDGSVPEDNPFVDVPGALPEIFSYGHRNVQGLALHPATGELWAHEHGPQGGDEINILEPGANYGWPTVSFGVEYGSGKKIGEGTVKPGVTSPIFQWTPSMAPSGMAFMDDTLLIGSLKFQYLSVFKLVEAEYLVEEKLFERQFGRIRDVHVSGKGAIYLLTDSPKGQIVRTRLQ